MSQHYPLPPADPDAIVWRLPSGKPIPLPKSMPQEAVDRAMAHYLDMDIAARAQAAQETQSKGVIGKVVEGAQRAINAPFKALPPGRWPWQTPAAPGPPPGAVPGSPGFSAPPWALPFAGVAPTTSPGIPRTPTQAALTATAGPLAKIAPVTGLGAMINPALRVGAAAGIGAGVETATGGSAQEGALTGALSGGIGEVGRLPANVRELAGRFLTRGKRLDIATRDATDAMMGAMRDVPSFQALLPGSKNPSEFLARLTQGVPGEGRRTLGQKLLSEHFATSEGAVVKALGGPGVDVQVPSLRLALASKAEMDKLGPQVISNAPMRVQDALDSIKRLVSEALEAGTGAHALWEAVDKGRKELLAPLTTKAPGVAKEYLLGLGVYQRGKAFLDALGASKALQGETRSGVRDVFDGNAFLEYLTTKQLHGLLHNTSKMLRRGGALTSVDVEKILPKFRLYRAGESTMLGVPPLLMEPRGGAGLWPNPGRTSVLPGLGGYAGSQASPYTGQQ